MYHFHFPKFYLLTLFFLLFFYNIQGQKNKHRKSKFKSKANNKQLQKSKNRATDFEKQNLFFQGLNNYLLERHEESLKALLDYEKIDQRGTGSVSYLIAKIYLSMGSDLEALDYIKKAIAHSDTNLDYYDVLIAILSKANDNSKLLSVYASLFEKITDLPVNYYLNCIDLRIQLEEYSKALELILKAEVRFGWLADLMSRKAQVYQFLEKYEEALKTIEEMIKYYPEIMEYKRFKTNLLMSKKDYKQVEIYLKSSLEDNPSDETILFDLCRLYLETEEQLKLSTIAGKIFKLKNFPVKLKLVIFFSLEESLKDPDRMANFVSILSEKHPDNKDISLITASYLQKNEPRKARSYFKKVLQQEPDNYDVWLNVLRLDFTTDEYDSLVKDTEEALEYFPNKTQLYLFLGNGYIALKNYRKAKANLEYGKAVLSNSLDFDKVELNDFNRYLADTYYSLENSAKAFQLYQEILDYDSNDLHALNNYSYYLSLEKKNLDIAKIMSSKLIQLEPNNPTYLDTYGWVLFQLEEFTEALKYLQKAVDLEDEPDPVILDHLADTFFKLNNRAKAMVLWKKALQTAKSPEKEEILKKLDTNQ